MDQQLQNDAMESFLAQKRRDSCASSSSGSTERDAPLGTKCASATSGSGGSASYAFAASSPFRLVAGLITGGEHLPGLPQHEMDDIERPRAPEILDGNNKIAADAQLGRSEHIMICLPGEGGRYDLHQVEFVIPPVSNVAFWDHMRAEYMAKRTPSEYWHFTSWLRKRRVLEIHFIYFLTTETIPTTGIQVLARPCVPHNEEGWECMILPHEDPSRAPIDAPEMAESLHGQQIREGRSHYALMPRKLEALPNQPNILGWGLYFVETESRKKWVVMVFVMCALVAYFGIRATVIADKDAGISGALGVSGNLIMVVAAILATIALGSSL
jgi:hypothetical protein